MPSMQEMVRSILDDDEGSERPKKGVRSRPEIMAQYSELRTAYNALQDRHDIQPGMFVKFKKGVSPLSSVAVGHPIAWIVVRKLDLENEMDYMIVADRIKMVMETVHSSALIPVSDDEAEAF